MVHNDVIQPIIVAFLNYFPRLGYIMYSGLLQLRECHTKATRKYLIIIVMIFLNVKYKEVKAIIH